MFDVYSSITGCTGFTFKPISRVFSMVVLFAHAPQLLGGTFGFKQIDYPGASSTFVNSINNAGQVVGTYRDSADLAHGFLFSGGVFTQLDFPGSPETFANGINNAGAIVGWNGSASYEYAGGLFTTFNVPGSIRTIAIGLNDHGDVVGGYIDSSNAGHGFLYQGGVFSSIDVPGAVDTAAYGVNNSLEIVGQASPVANGFLLVGGTISPIPDVPGSLGTLSASRINNLGHIIGQYSYATGEGGYILRNGDFDSVVFPGSTFVRPNGLNDFDVIVGDFIDASGQVHGFLATPTPEMGTFQLLAGAFAIGLAVQAARRKLIELPMGRWQGARSFMLRLRLLS
jgi:probable HAF family extracellular repeat protein